MFDISSDISVVLSTANAERYALTLDGVRAGGVKPGTPMTLVVAAGQTLDSAKNADAHAATTSTATAIRPADTSTASLWQRRVALIATSPRIEVLATWDVLVGNGPNEIPAIAKAHNLERSKRLKDARKSLHSALPKMSAWDRVWATAELARMVGPTQESIPAWERSAEVARQASVPSEAVTRLQNAAFHALWSGQLKRAQRDLTSADQIIDELNDPFLRALGLYYRGLVAWQLGYYLRAADAIEEATKLLERYGKDFEASQFKRFLSTIQGDLGRHNKALVAMADVFQALSKSNKDDVSYKANLPESLNDLGWIQLRAMAVGAIPENLAEPRRHLTAAADLYRSAKATSREAAVLGSLAYLEYLAKDYPRALSALQRAKDISPGEGGGQAQFRDLVEADVRLAMEDPKTALPLYRKVLTVSSADDSAWRAHYGLARVSLALGKQSKALTSLETALRIRRRIAARAAIRKGQATFLADRADVIRAATEAYLDAGLTDRAFQVDESGRAEVLRSLNTEVRRARLSAVDRQGFDKRVLDYTLLRQQADSTKGDQAKTLDAKAKATFDGLFEWLDERVPPEADALTVPQVQAQLIDREAVITFSRRPEGVLSFWVDRNKIQHRTGPAGADLWSDALSEVDHVYVVPGDVPLARDLHTAATSDGRPLIETVSISYLPHAGFLVPRGPSVDTGAPLVIAVAGEGPQRLAYVDEEVQAVAARLPAASLLREAAADRKTVLAEMNSRPLVHFAGHGVIRLADPWDAHLTLGDGDRLTLENLLIARPRVAAAVLNGCETGKGGSLSRREAVGLAEGFLAIGTRWVLATTDRIRDDRAFAFVRAFYDAGGAKNPTTAFRTVARQQIQAGASEWRSYRLFGRRR